MTAQLFNRIRGVFTPEIAEKSARSRLPQAHGRQRPKHQTGA
jgi:hypothetical protein